MAVDIITIWNQAISAAGGRGSISSSTEAGREADLCRLWYSTVRRNVIKSASWPSAKRAESLALLSTRDFSLAWTSTDPLPTWKYAYATPADLLAPRYLASFGRFERAYYAPADSVAIMTADAPAILHYMFDQQDVTKWDAGMESTVIHLLAAQLCMPLTAKITRSKELAAQARVTLQEAQTEVANEQDVVYDTLPSWISARGYSESPREFRYVYPHEELVGVLI